MANVDELQVLIRELSGKIDTIGSKLDRSNADFLVYQKANQSLTNLAFSLIASATVITIVTNVFSQR